MKKEDEEIESVPLREECNDPRWERVEEEVKDEILYRKVEKPTKVAHAGEILKFC
jgi:hypothetical protein